MSVTFKGNISEASKALLKTSDVVLAVLAFHPPCGEKFCYSSLKVAEPVCNTLHAEIYRVDEVVKNMKTAKEDGG